MPVKRGRKGFLVWMLAAFLSAGMSPLGGLAQKAGKAFQKKAATQAGNTSSSVKARKSVPHNFLTIFPDDQAQWKEASSFPWSPLNAPSGGKFVQGVLGRFETLHMSSREKTTPSGLTKIHGTLFKASPNEDGVAYPFVAESVQIDGSKVTFFLNPKATFHDGVAVKPEDVIFSFHTLTKESFLYRQQFSMVDKVLPAGKNSVTFIFKKEACKEAPVMLATFLIVLPKHFFQKTNLNQNPWTLPVGCGPYRLHHVEPGRSVHYKKVPKWWGGNLAFARGAYHFEDIHIEYFLDENAFFQAFKKGELDAIEEMFAARWHKEYHFPAVREQKILKIQVPVASEALAKTGLIFNIQDPIFKDLRVRWALNILFPFDDMNAKVFYKSYQRNTSYFQDTKAMAKGRPSKEEKDILRSVGAPQDIEDMSAEDMTIFKASFSQRRRQALNLLKNAGWTLRNGILYHEQHGPFEIRFVDAAKRGSKFLQFFQRTLSSVGIRLKIHAVDDAAYMDKLRRRDFQMTYGITSVSSGHPGQELLSIYGAASSKEKDSYNIFGIADKVVDALIQKILSSKSYAELTLYARCLDRYLLSQCFSILGWNFPFVRIAYWNKFGVPKDCPYFEGYYDYWWAQPETVAPSNLPSTPSK